MKNYFDSNVSRRDFVKLTTMMAASMSLPALPAFASSSQFKKPAIDYHKELRLENGNVIDVKTGTIYEGGTVRIRDGRIIYAGRKLDNVDATAQVIDLNRKYVIPGLIDGHLHMTLPPVSAFRYSLAPVIIPLLLSSFPKNVESGVTTVRDTAALSRLMSYCVGQVDKGNLIGPRVVHSNTWVNVKGGYLDLKTSDITIFLDALQVLTGSVSINAAGPGQLEEQLKDKFIGASYLKLSSMDNKSLLAGKDEIIPTYSDEQLRTIFNFAEKNDLPVTAHIMTAHGYRRAMQYPFSYLEHVAADDILTDKEIQHMVDNKITFIPTMANGNLYAFGEEAFEVFPKEFHNDFVENEVKIRKDWWNSITEKDVFPVVHACNNDALAYFKQEHFNMQEMYRKRKITLNPFPFLRTLTKGKQNLLRMKQAGVTIGLGTDAGVPMNYHGNLWREFDIFSRMGWGNLEILQTATLVNSKICFMEDKIGSLEAGKYADITVLDGNPLADTKAYRNPPLVFKEGKLLSQKCEIHNSVHGLTLA